MTDHAAIVQAIYEAFGRGDVAGILEHVADDVQWESWTDNSAQKGGVPWMQARSGKAAVGEFFALVASTLRIQDFRVLSIMAGADQVAAEFVIEADVVPTGKRYRDEEMHLWTFNGEGKVVRLRHYLDTAKHLDAGVAQAAA
jgi:ketosteroid isomerase-like protein